MDIMHISKPQGKTADDLVYLWQQAFGDSEEYIRSFMDASFYRGCVVMESDDRVVAAVHLTCPTDDDRFVYGYAVATLKGYQGKGICRMLHESIFAACREKYATYAVHPANVSLVSFYEKLGMKISTYRYFSNVEGDGGKYTFISPREYCEMRRMFLGEINEDWLKAGEYTLLGFDIDGMWCAAAVSVGTVWEIIAPPQLEGAAAKRAAAYFTKARLSVLCDTPIASECAVMTYNGTSDNFALYVE